MLSWFLKTIKNQVQVSLINYAIKLINSFDQNFSMNHGEVIFKQTPEGIGKGFKLCKYYWLKSKYLLF